MNSLAPAVSPLLARGVYRAPYLGPDREVVLFAVDASHRIPEGGERLIPLDADLGEPTAELWRLLDVADPEHSRRRKG